MFPWIQDANTCVSINFNQKHFYPQSSLQSSEDESPVSAKGLVFTSLPDYEKHFTISQTTYKCLWLTYWDAKSGAKSWQKKAFCANFFMLIICIFTHFWFQNTIVWSHFQIIGRKCTLTCLMPLVQKISYWHFVCNDFQRGRSWHSAFEPEDNLLSLPGDGFDQISQTPEIVQLTPFHTSSMIKDCHLVSNTKSKFWVENQSYIFRLV